MERYESVLGIPWKSTKSDAETDCYYTYVIEQCMRLLADPEGDHHLDANDIDDCRQVVFLHANRCIKYFNPEKAKVSTFVTRLIKQGVHKYLTDKYGGEQHLAFSDFEASNPHNFAMSTAIESDFFEVGNRLTAGYDRAKSRALSKYEQTRLQSDSMHDPEDDNGE